MPRLPLWIACLSAVLCLPGSGCLESQAVTNSAPFEEQDLDAVLAIVIDMSGSYSAMWEEKAYPLFLDLSDRFFQGAMGTETRLVIGQLSGNDQVLLFEGRPADLRQRFSSPEELHEFLKANSDPGHSPVDEATRRTLDYLTTLSGVGPRTRLLTVILSDMQNSPTVAFEQTAAEGRLKESLQRYQSRGGGLALYYVAESERERWTNLLREAGFESGHFLIESDLTSSPQLPKFE